MTYLHETYQKLALIIHHLGLSSRLLYCCITYVTTGKLWAYISEVYLLQAQVL